MAKIALSAENYTKDGNTMLDRLPNAIEINL